MKPVIKFFSSVKLAIVLLIILASTSIVGTLIPQQRTPSEYLAHYGQLGHFLMRLQLTRLYHSFWFVALLALFALNISVCTLERLSPKLRKTFRPRLETEPKAVLALKIRDRFKKSLGLSQAGVEVTDELRKRGYRIRAEQKETTQFLLARKRVLNWYGADTVHLGLLVILIGGIISGLLSYRENLSFTGQQTLPISKASFQVRLDRFETEFYPNGAVRDWISTLTILENGRPVLSRAVEVNHPLSYGGFVFYQSGYGWDWENPRLELVAKKKDDAGFSQSIQLKVGEKAKLPNTAMEIIVRRFVPDFMIDDKNEVVTRSLDANNPAALIEGWEAGQQVFSGWIFAKFPDFAKIHSSKETNLSFELKDFKAGQYSVIEVAKDPGVNVIWLGCALLMAGLFLAFYWPSREIKIILEEVEGKTEIMAGGIAAKSREAFEREFRELMAVLRRSK
jgi:cytochrome c biogenesis protein